MEGLYEFKQQWKFSPGDGGKGAREGGLEVQLRSTAEPGMNYPWDELSGDIGKWGVEEGREGELVFFPYFTSFFFFFKERQFCPIA